MNELINLYTLANKAVTVTKEHRVEALCGYRDVPSCSKTEELLRPRSMKKKTAVRVSKER